MGRDSLGIPLIVSAVILAAGIVGASLIVRSSLDRGAEQLAGMRAAVADLAKAAPAAPTAPPSRVAARPSRPDPSRRYQVELGSSPVKGPEDAEITIVEFSDFQCPFCRRVTPTLDQIEKEYGDQVRVAFKHLPLSIHPKAPAAHAAAEAARRQGKFWEMHDRIFANQQEMSPEKYVEYAAEMGLDVDQFKRDVTSSEVKSRIDSDSREAAGLGVTGTPAFFVNGRYLSGAQPFASFKRLIDEELAN